MLKFFTVFMITVCTVFANAVWERPVVLPVPESVSGVANPIVSLNGTWKFTLSPTGNFWENTVDPSSWSDVVVPGELAMQGFAIQQNMEFPYKKEIQIPADFADKKVFLRFDGVYSYARVWVNGTHIENHYGGFTSWQCEITSQVKPGEKAMITVGVKDLSDDLSTASHYAKHLIGGILRNVTLYALPKNHLTRLHVETDFDNSYQDAVLKVMAGIDFSNGDNATIQLQLSDPAGAPVSITPSTISLTKATPEDTIEIAVSNPLKWDAEHPMLYTLTAQVNGQTEHLPFGFREIKIDGNKMLVNGKEVKLRGGNMHSIHPTLGRVSLDDLTETDVILYKQANVNLIRTSHYPPTDRLLDLCDKYGIYVEDETAVCWVGPLHPGPSYYDDLSKTGMFLTQLGEMVESHRSHPSVVIWSLGNESYWGKNFQKERDYLNAEDPTRPVIFSFPDRQKVAPVSGYDIYSQHYFEYNVDLGKDNMPMLHDEYAHVSCYNLPDLNRDPNVHNYWGESIKKFWENMFTTSGSLGGAIWGTIDEIFYLPGGNAVGYGPWGIFDVWRRPKPEYWHTKKAYSPIRIENKALAYPGNGSSVSMPIKNWFDHTNLDEVKVVWSLSGSRAAKGELTGPDVAPHKEGLLEIPVGTYQENDVVGLQFFDSQNIMVDEFKLPIGDVNMDFPAVQGPAPSINETAEAITVTGDDFTVTFSKTTGLISQGVYKSQNIISGGPYLHHLYKGKDLDISSLNTGTWRLGSINATTAGNEAVISIAGSYTSYSCSFEVRIDAAGLITTNYTINSFPANTTEFGIAYVLYGKMNRLSWKRKGLWSSYPGTHIGRNMGTADKMRGGISQAYGEAPVWPYKDDMIDFFLDKTGGQNGTNDFRSTKGYIYYAYAYESGSSEAVRVESNGTQAVRAEKFSGTVDGIIDDGNTGVKYSGNWSAHTDAGDLNGTEHYSNETAASVEYAFTGSSISWYGSKNKNQGIAEVYIDNNLVNGNVDCYNGSGKMYQQILFSKQDLTDASHTIKIVISGKKNAAASDSYIVIDGFSTTANDAKDNWPVKLIVNDQWSYPNIGWGNYTGNISLSAGYKGTVKMRLTVIDSSEILSVEPRSIVQRHSKSLLLSGKYISSIDGGVIQYFISRPENVQFSVYSLSGKKLYLETIPTEVSGWHTISLAGKLHSTGLYIFSLKTVGQSYQGKFWVTKK
ncbi:MAG: T9SS type A sorting domain-containing protein [Fibrobacteria bacterium]|nr:T9SS type A sorting domain-containing protein [Fibrobacteria bacterium]